MKQYRPDSIVWKESARQPESCLFNINKSQREKGQLRKATLAVPFFVIVITSVADAPYN